MEIYGGPFSPILFITQNRFILQTPLKFQYLGVIGALRPHALPLHLEGCFIYKVKSTSMHTAQHISRLFSQTLKKPVK